MPISVFKKILASLRKARTGGYQFSTLRIIFDVKVYLRRKYRLVIDGHVVDLYGHEVYAITMNSVSTRTLRTITAANNF